MSAWFFIDSMQSEYTITGEDALHISKSLRMAAGEQVTLCDESGVCHVCEITELAKNYVTVKEIEFFTSVAEPNIKITLYQALTKSDKMDLIVQKAVELGVSRIVPILTKRCISRPDEKTMRKKIERWNKIARGAAMQSRRGIVPKVENLMTLEQSTKDCLAFDCGMVFYEKHGDRIVNIMSNCIDTAGIFIGSEGGFDEDEITFLNNANIKSATLGNRILRTETAPLAALSIIMYITDNI